MDERIVNDARRVSIRLAEIIADGTVELAVNISSPDDGYLSVMAHRSDDVRTWSFQTMVQSTANDNLLEIVARMLRIGVGLTPARLA